MRLNIYLVDRIEDDYDYDDYIDFIVVAKTPEGAIELTVKEHFGEYSGWETADKLKSKLVGKALPEDKEPYILHESFNAG